MATTNLEMSERIKELDVSKTDFDRVVFPIGIVIQKSNDHTWSIIPNLDSDLEVSDHIKEIDISKTDFDRVVFPNGLVLQKSNDQTWNIIIPNPDSKSHSNLNGDLIKSQKYVQLGLPTLDAAGPIVPSPAIEDRIWGVLQRSKDPLSALTIARQVGETTASDVNPTLYRLECERIICKTTTGIYIAPLWKIADDPPTMRDDQQSANANPPQYSQAGIGGDVYTQVLYIKTESEGEIKFREVYRPTDNTPTVTPIDETVGGPHSIQESSIANPSTATPREIRPIQASGTGRASTPIQIELDDRIQQSTDEPVTPPNPINFAERGKEIGKNEKSKTKNFMQSFKSPFKKSDSPNLLTS